MKTYTQEQIWNAVRKTWHSAKDAYVMPDGQLAPVAPSEDELDELREVFFDTLDVESGAMTQQQFDDKWDSN